MGAARDQTANSPVAALAQQPTATHPGPGKTAQLYEPQRPRRGVASAAKGPKYMPSSVPELDQRTALERDKRAERADAWYQPSLTSYVPRLRRKDPPARINAD